MKPSKLLLLSLTLLLALPAAPQQARSNIAASASTAVPPLIPYSGVVNTVPGAQPAGSASVTFLIYKDEQGGEPLFTETQAVALDVTGHYNAQLGATLTNGIPMNLFATGEARWLEVQVAGEPQQPRVLLVSVPYALKAADAATLGGLPPSAFVLARSSSDAASAVSPAITPNVTSNVTTTGGIAGYIPKFSGASSVVDSSIFLNATGQVGIGTTTPTATLNVQGTMTVSGDSTYQGSLVLPAMGTATASTAYKSSLMKFYTSAYNSSSKTVVSPRFEWQAEPGNNNTAAPTVTLKLLSSTTTASPMQTGFYFNADGTIHFAPGQTFPGGTGTGTITGVTAGTALTGGGTSGNVTLKLDTTKVPLLAANNTFTGNQAITGKLTVSGTASAGTVNAVTAYDLGGALFAVGSKGSGNVYLGFAGNSSTTGTSNTASGINALLSNNTGTNNTGSGAYALSFNTKGDSNTASGVQALYSNTTGSDNTASGEVALVFNTTGSDNTANGFEALYSNNLGFDNTASGFQALLSNTEGCCNTAGGIRALSSNTTGDYNVGIGDGAGNTVDGSELTGSSNIAIGVNAGFGTGSITNATAIGAQAAATQSNTMVLGCVPTSVNSCFNSISVGIGTTTPDNLLTVNGSADKPGGGSWGTYSDGRLKTVNGSFGSGLGQVMQLRPIRYRYKPDNALGIRDSDEHIGVVAQEVQRVIPEAVTENGKGYLLVNNDPIIWSMVNAIKEQQREIEQQQKLLRAQSAAMRSLAAEVRETRKTLRQLNAQTAAGQLTMVASR
jgi:hypothetical protein